ncbi:MAG: hypothetical protein ONB12_10995, partial [candidate division KSB1 bacterium]|nr:hypothetical protein [candidate division KSB1 bacterium]
GEILGQDAAINVRVENLDNLQGEDVEAFDAVVIGSSVRAERPLANVRDFFALNRDVLAQKKVALFAVCLAAATDEGREKVRRDYLGFITEKYPELKFLSSEAFGGKIDLQRLNPIMRRLMQRVLQEHGLPITERIDTRDWQFIEAWALGLKEKLLGNNGQ